MAHQSGKILIKSLQTLVTGRSSTLGSAITKWLINQGGAVCSLDQRAPFELHANKKTRIEERFTRGNVADENFLQTYLRNINQLDALVNCAAVRKSYNYYMSYLLSKNILEKFKENEINEFGCRGCIINLVHLSSDKFDDKYFEEQDTFASKYGIETDKIDDQVYQLADLLTAARVRCNTVLVNDQCDPQMFAQLVTHIIQDQYLAGQVINMEDDLKHKTPSFKQVLGEMYLPKKPKIQETPYTLPKSLEQVQNNEQSTLSLPLKESKK